MFKYRNRLGYIIVFHITLKNVWAAQAVVRCKMTWQVICFPNRGCAWCVYYAFRFVFIYPHPLPSVARAAARCAKRGLSCVVLCRLRCVLSGLWFIPASYQAPSASRHRNLTLPRAWVVGSDRSSSFRLSVVCQWSEWDSSFMPIAIVEMNNCVIDTMTQRSSITYQHILSKGFLYGWRAYKNFGPKRNLITILSAFKLSSRCKLHSRMKSFNIHQWEKKQ